MVLVLLYINMNLPGYFIHSINSGYVYVNPGDGNGTPVQYSCLENPMGGGAW